MAIAHRACFLAVALFLGVTCSAHSVPREVPWVWGTELPLSAAGNTVHLEGGDIVRFQSTAGSHDVWMFADEAHYNTCDFTGATEIKALATAFGDFDYTVSNDGFTNDMKWMYFGCKVTSHCDTGFMKVKVMAHTPGTLPAAFQHTHAPTATMNPTAAPTAGPTAAPTAGPTFLIHAVPWVWGTELPLSAANNTVHAEGDDILRFNSTAGSHDVFMFADEAHYNTCNFTGATELKAEAAAFGEYDYTIPDGGYTADVKWMYFGCSVPNHCETGFMKVKVMAHAKGTFRTTPSSGASGVFTGVGLALVGLAYALMM